MNLSGIVIAFVVAVLTHTFQFHDRISDVLGIRRRFDCKSILIPLSQRVGSVVTKDKEAKIAQRRDELMHAVFYKYASSRDDHPLVDKHDIEHALNAWSWLWVPHVASTFDYGCGKLRYQRAIADTTDVLAIVDSEVQLSRLQVLRRRETSIQNLFKQSNRIQVYNDLEFQELNTCFERGFCINVPSVIPSYARRRKLLDVIHGKLRDDGECLFVVQYRNSDFTRMRKMSKAKPWLDGFIIDSLRGYSFYGLILPDRLEASLKRAGFRVRETKLNEGSTYTWASLA